ncbi:MAG: FAD-dependent oxidoreductase, partial [Deltaproteobacteria bacterium]|nr:FAD-dependent oxidoreductase [Deltaproteobacteria bacterium]
MKIVRETVDVVIAGGGTAGHVAAIQAARAGVKTAVVEAGSMLGGTMTDGGVYMPNHFFSIDGPVVQGIAWELYTKSKAIEGLPVPDYRKRRPLDTPGYYSYINVPIYAALAEREALEAGVVIHYHEFVAEVRAVGGIWEIVSLGRGIRRITRAREIIDCSGDADVVRILGLGVERARRPQPGAYQYKIEGIEYEQVWKKEVQQIYDEAVAAGKLEAGDFAYARTKPFSYYLAHGGHNATHLYAADTSDAEGQTRANLDGRARMLRMFQFLKSEIPGCERAVLKTMYGRALSRESYRVKGEYTITRKDFMQAKDFKDKVCNAFNYIDMHSREKGCEEIFHASEHLVPTVPFRALIPKGASRLTVAGRIVSAERMALAGIRAQCVCMAMGQAMGAAAAMAVKKGVP